MRTGPVSQVINAALTLAARPQSKVAQDNMDVFKDQWEKQVRVLTEAVDDITSVDDFLSVSGTAVETAGITWWGKKNCPVRHNGGNPLSPRRQGTESSLSPLKRGIASS